MKLSLGIYPAVSLKDARERRDAAKRLLASGINPGQQKKAEAVMKANAEANTFDAIAVELLDKKLREENSERTIQKARWLLSLASPAPGPRPITEITASDILAVHCRKSRQA